MVVPIPRIGPAELGGDAERAEDDVPGGSETPVTMSCGGMMEGGALRGVGGRLPEMDVVVVVVVEFAELPIEAPSNPLPAAAAAEPLIERCREQKPRRCDSFVQPSFEQSRRHCFPLNFFRMPFGAATMSPFLNLLAKARAAAAAAAAAAAEELDFEPCCA